MKNRNYICNALCLRNSVAYDHDFWYNSIKWWYLLAFFSFFKILMFRVVRGVKGQKMAQNDKKLLLHLISQEPYIIWSSFMVHTCKRIKAPPSFCIFSKFWFLGSIMGKKGKQWPKMTKTYVWCTPYIRKHTSYDNDYRYNV